MVDSDNQDRVLEVGVIVLADNTGREVRLVIHAMTMRRTFQRYYEQGGHHDE